MTLHPLLLIWIIILSTPLLILILILTMITNSSQKKNSHTEAQNSPRRSKRVTRPPAYLDDFHCNISDHWCGLVKLIVPSTISQTHTHIELKSYKQVVLNALWKNTMDIELLALERNKT